MEFIKIGKDKYLIKSSNGRLVSEKEKLEIENNELVLQDFQGCDCQEETTKKIRKNKKRIKEIETATSTKENADDTIQETDIVI